ncbi:MAG TPA: hypothetical protein VM389_10135 [Phycisphaerae bacterium]|nr:hypothetical protein [Phycisphaerae bacterium]
MSLLYNPDWHFGRCPECGQTDGYLNIGRTHVFVCDRHRTQWTVGANLFSSWKHEDEDTWTENAKKIHDYREVEPVHSQFEFRFPRVARFLRRLWKAWYRPNQHRYRRRADAEEIPF